jgi:hypothetical protein
MTDLILGGWFMFGNNSTNYSEQLLRFDIKCSFLAVFIFKLQLLESASK